MKISPRDREKFTSEDHPNLSVVLVYGPDRGLMRTLVERQFKAVIGEDDGFSLERFSGDDEQVVNGGIIDAALQISLMGGRRAVVVIDPKETIHKDIETLLGREEEQPSLIVLGGGNLPPRSKLRSLCESHPRAAAIACYLDEARDLGTLVREWAAREGISVNRDCGFALVELLGADRAVSEAALEKLALYCADQARPYTLTIDDIERCIVSSNDLSTDDVAFACFGGQTTTALGTIDRAVKSGLAPEALFASTLNHARRLFLVVSQLEQRVPYDQAVRSLAPPVFFKRKAQFESQVRSWQKNGTLKQAVLFFEEAAEQARFGDPIVVLERCVITLNQMGQSRAA